MTSRVMRSSGINKPVGIAGSWRFCAVNVSVRSLRRKFYIYICMQATRRVEIVLVNRLTEGVWLLTTTDPYRTAVVVLVHVFGPPWLKSPLTSPTPPTNPVVMEQGLYLAIFSVCACFQPSYRHRWQSWQPTSVKSINSNPNLIC